MFIYRVGAGTIAIKLFLSRQCENQHAMFHRRRTMRESACHFYSKEVPTALDSIGCIGAYDVMMFAFGILEFIDIYQYGIQKKSWSVFGIQATPQR